MFRNKGEGESKDTREDGGPLFLSLSKQESIKASPYTLYKTTNPKRMVAEGTQDPNSREAQFLASQKARLDQIKEFHEKDDSENQKRKEFWKAFKIECNTIQKSLSSFGNKDSPALITAHQRNQALDELQQIQLEIRAIEHYTLHSTKFTKEEEAYLPTYLKENDMPDLPIADTRLINIEISKLKNMIGEAQNIILPKEKFSFKRYRRLVQTKNEALNAILDEETHNESNSHQIQSDDPGDGSKPLTSNDTITFFDGHSISNWTYCHIQVLPNGTLNVTHTKTQFTETIPSSTGGTKVTALLIRDVENCTVSIHGIYNSIHVMNVKSTQIKIQSPVHGPVHVTECFNSTIKIPFSRQLRIHDCINVNFVIHVASGPIIEGCKGMRFYQKNYKKHNKEDVDESIHTQDLEKVSNLYWDVKDFHWLKQIKSPNFMVHKEDQARLDDMVKHLYIEESGISTTDTPSSLEILEPIHSLHQDSIEDDESSDDEL